MELKDFVRFRVVRPLVIHSDGPLRFLTSIPQVTYCGIGTTDEEALEDLKNYLEKLYKDLKNHAEKEEEKYLFNILSSFLEEKENERGSCRI